MHRLIVFVVAIAVGLPVASTAGTIKGHVKLTGAAPPNPAIRMGSDPVCAALNRRTGATPAQPIVVTDAGGGLANTFISLQGNFPATPVPAEPVTIVQRNCQYLPRVVAARVGQTLRIVNQDTTLHNLHSQSTMNVFNVTQPRSGMVFDFPLKAAEVMMRLTCDAHRWMFGYIAVMTHPYFAVSGADGSYTIANVPPGRYTVKTWHERFGEQTKTVVVAADGAATLDIAYQPRSAR